MAFHTDNGIFPVTHETAETVRNAAHALADAGLSVTEDCPPGLSDLMEVGAALGDVSGDGRARRGLSGVQRTVELGIRGAHAVRRSLVGAVTRRSRDDSAHDGCRVLAWTRKWDACRSALLGFMGRYDVILCPVDPHPALPARGDDAAGLPGHGVTAYTKPYSMAGWPSVVVRAGTSQDGMPIGCRWWLRRGRSALR